MWKANAAETLGLAVAALGVSAWLHAKAGVLDRWNLPRPVTAGLLLAGLSAGLRSAGLEGEFDTALRDLLTLAFFTTIGLRASVALLVRGGRMVAACLALALVGAVLQNAVGVAMARLFGVDPLLGIIAGATTLAGGPATALAFGKTFEEMGVADAQSAGLAAAVFGILAAGLLSGAVGGWLLRGRAGVAEESGAGPRVERRSGEAIYTLAALALALGVGSVLSRWIASAGVTLPGYIGAMLVAAVIRAADDAGARRLDDPLLDRVGTWSLALFIAMALLTVKLWALTALALPLLGILAVQVVVTIGFAVVLVFRGLGGGYEGAVGTAGWTGFMLGTTANAVAAMDVLEARHGAAPQSRLAIPVVGAFLIDFTNSFVILTTAGLVRRFLL